MTWIPSSIGVDWANPEPPDPGDHHGLDAHWDQRIPQDGDCPAGGEHVPTYDSSHPDRMYDRTPHCDECQCPLPIPEPQDP